MDDVRIRLADFVLPLLRRRRLIVGIVGAVAVLSAGASLLWPKTWRATATLLPPERRMDNPLFVPGNFEALGASLRGITLRHVATPTDIFIAILQSRNVREAIIKRFGLQEEYGVPSLEKALRRLAKDTTVRTTRDGTILVQAVARSPERAAEIANAYVEELDRLNHSLALREAGAIRRFIEKELDEAKGRLAAAEEKLRAFQEGYGAVEITEQARAVIGAAAEVSAKILAAEVELGVLRRTRDETHPEVVRARDYLEELKNRLAEIEGSYPPAPVSTQDTFKRPAPVEGAATDTAGSAQELLEPREIFPPLSRMPALGLRYGRLYREVKTEEAVVALLTEQYHRARIEERRSLPTVRVLDPAVVPERRYRPRRTLMVLASTAAALILATLLAYGLEVTDRIRAEPGRYAGLHEIARELRRGLRT